MIVSAAIQLFHNRTPGNSHFLRAAFISPNTEMKRWKLDGTVRSSCRETKACGVKVQEDLGTLVLVLLNMERLSDGSKESVENS